MARGRDLAVSFLPVTICVGPITQAGFADNVWLREEQFALAEVSYIIVRLMQSFNRAESRDSGLWGGKSRAQLLLEKWRQSCVILKCTMATQLSGFCRNAHNHVS